MTVRTAITRAALAVVVLCAPFAALAPSASAARSYDSEITGAGNPSRAGGTEPSFAEANNITIEGNDQLRVVMSGCAVHDLYKYDAYPSQTLIGPPPDLTFGPPIGFCLNFNMASDNATGQLFMAEWNSRVLYTVNADNVSEQPWDTAANGAVSSDTAGFFAAVDNTSSYSGSRLYLSLVSPEDVVAAYDVHHRPVEFPATSPYITGNRLTGTPSGPFGKVGAVTVDSGGDIYVVDQGKNVIDEFDSDGIFLRTLDGTGAPGEFTPAAVGIDPTNGNLLIEVENSFTGATAVDEFDESGNFLDAITADPHGPLQASGPGITLNEPADAVGDVRVNSNGYLYLPQRGRIDIFTPTPPVPTADYHPVSAPTATAGTLNATVDPNGGGEVTDCRFEYGTTTAYGAGTLPCGPATHFSTATDVSAELAGLTTGTSYHYRVVAEDADGVKYGTDQTYTPHGVIALETEAATELSEAGARLNAFFLGNGEGTHYHFEWGPTAAYGHETADELASPGAGSTEGLVATLSGLPPYSTFHFRVVASNASGTSYGADRTFTTTPGTPTVKAEFASRVHSDRAVLSAEVDPNGADTGFHFEYVTAAEYEESGFATAKRAPATDSEVGRSKNFQPASTQIDELTPGTVYRYRAVATNQIGSGTSGVVRSFTTFPFGFSDSCPNAHVRQQTGAALLLDCRAYELVSAANAGGYDVESNLVTGQTPFGGYPLANSRFLYGVHNGAIPGTGNPTNHGLDPYVATRGDDGWSTRYVGIPANGTPSGASFASTLDEADATLGTFAFGGSDLCAPCFADGSSGTPIHLPNGRLVQGMTGSIPQPAAQPAGFIAKHFSADGVHFVFGSTSKLEPDGNEGEISIYDRNLDTEKTHVVSKTPGGGTMSGPGIGELDISKDGSRILIGRLVGETEGAKHWQLYMNVGDSSKTIELTPGASSGVLYDGMNAGGTKVFFTTTDQLTSDDEDESGDIYEAEVGTAGAALTRVSTGSEGTGNSDLCDPTPNTVYQHWNTTGSEEGCGVVAVGGGGGVASGAGTIYFLSPEKLDGSGNGVENAPNLYVSDSGQAPHFVATLESGSNAPVPPAAHPMVRSFGNFNKPSGVAIDHATGDVYVLEIGTDIGPGTLWKFDSSGHPVLSFGSSGRITVSGEVGFYGLPTEIAVDETTGDLYVPSFSGAIVKKYGPEGEHLNDLIIGTPTGVAVDQVNGHVYASSAFGNKVVVFDSSGTELTSFPTISQPTGVAVDSNERAYVVNGGGVLGNEGTTEVYDSLGTDLGQLDGNPSKAVAVDPADDHVYVDEGGRVIEFELNSAKPEESETVGPPIGVGLLEGSFGITADSGTLEVSNPGTSKVVTYGPAVVPPEPRTDNPLVIDSVTSPDIRNSADFEVSPSGEDAAFTSTLPLTEYDNAEVHREVFRYESGSGISCASCNPTGEQATGEASLPSDGLGLTDDGRVFFNSTEGLVDRDLNNNQDAYEWESGKGTELISTGTSSQASSLAGVSADGIDAYFFTHDTLVPEDENGSRVKVYDARSFGGFPIVPTPVPCSASDECHGPSSQAPPPPEINTIAGTPVGNVSPGTRCRKGTVRVRSKCVKHHQHRRRHHHKRASRHRGGGK